MAAQPEYLQGVRVPSRDTLRKYGLTRGEWECILAEQEYTCGVCRRVPSSGVLHIDHEHVVRWKQKTPEERKRFIRGLTCWFCNSVLLRRGANPDRLRAAAAYLEAYAAKKERDR